MTTALPSEYRLGLSVLLGASCAVMGLAVSISPNLAVGLAFLTVYVVCSSLSPKLALGLWLGVLCLIPTWFGITQFGMFLEIAAMASIASMPALLVHRRSFRLSPGDLLVAGVVVSAGLATLFAQSQLPSFEIMVTLGLFPYLIARVLVPAAGLDWTFRIFSIAMVAVAVFAIFEYLFNFHPFETFYTGTPLGFWSEIQLRAGAARSEVTFGHAIALGGCLAMAFPLTLGSSLKPAIKIIFIGILGLGVLTTASRGPLLAALLGLVLMLSTQGQGRKIRERFAILLMIGIFAVLFLVFLAPSLSTDSEATLSASYRSDLYSTLLPTINVLGPGDNYSLDINGAVNQGFQSIDSTFMLLGLTFGWIPLLIVVAGLALNGFKVVTGRSSAAGVALLANWPLFLTVGLICQYQPLLWFLVGITVSANQLARHGDPGGESPAPETSLIQPEKRISFSRP